MIHYILNGHEVVPTTSLEEWAIWFNQADELRRVAFSVIDEGLEVSTIFLGVDHRFIGEGPPLVFETMVFRGGDPQMTWRYSTWEEAEEGHKSIVSGLLNNEPEFTGERT